MRTRLFGHSPSGAGALARGPFPTFWLERHGARCQLTAWAGAGRALRSIEAPRSELITAALRAISELLGAPFERAEQALLGHHYHDFIRDPFARGAYSYVRPGGQWAHEWLAQPLEQTLFFAGEASDAEQPATVAGAIASGERAARQLLRRGRAQIHLQG